MRGGETDVCHVTRLARGGSTTWWGRPRVSRLKRSAGCLPCREHPASSCSSLGDKARSARSTFVGRPCLPAAGIAGDRTVRRTRGKCTCSPLEGWLSKTTRRLLFSWASAAGTTASARSERSANTKPPRTPTAYKPIHTPFDSSANSTFCIKQYRRLITRRTRFTRPSDRKPSAPPCALLRGRRPTADDR